LEWPLAFPSSRDKPEGEEKRLSGELVLFLPRGGGKEGRMRLLGSGDGGAAEGSAFSPRVSCGRVGKGRRRKRPGCSAVHLSNTTTRRSNVVGDGGSSAR